MEFDVGRVIGDKYRLVRLLGRGSMGEVWAAHHRTLNEHVALKLLTPPAPDEEAAESATAANARFLFEAQVAARLSRKTRHIVRVTDHGEEDGRAYLVMELLDGETLEAVIAHDGRLELLKVAEIIRQIARALGQAHGEGVAHRDLKPANVFLTHDEDGQLVAKLLDFGIARGTHAHRLPAAFSTAKGTIFGTPSYMSPEQARGSQRLDHRCDLWALATIAYEAASGELPIDDEDVDEIIKKLCTGKLVPIGARAAGLGARLGPFFERAFAYDIELRFQSAGELASAFARAVDAPVGEVSVPSANEAAPAVTSPAASTQGAPRRWLLVATGAALLTAVAAGLAWRAFARGPEVAVAHDPSGPAASSPAPLVPSAKGSAPAATSDEVPAIPISALPRVPDPPAIARPPAATGPAAASTPPVAAPPAPPASATATATSTARKKDRSEVF